MVLVDEGVGQLVERCRIAAVVQRVLVVDLAPVHASLGVDVVVVRPLPVDERREVRRQGPRLGRNGPDRDRIGRHARSGARGRRRPGRRRCHDQRARQQPPGEHGGDQRPDSLPPSHTVPNHLSRCIPPGMPVTVLAGLHRNCSPLVVVSLEIGWFDRDVCRVRAVCTVRLPLRKRRFAAAPFSVKAVRSSVRSPRHHCRHFKNSRLRSKSRSARTSSGPTAGSSSTWRATMGS